MAIKAEADRAAFRKAVIEKTVGTLFLMAIVGICGLVWSGIKGSLGK